MRSKILLPGALLTALLVSGSVNLPLQAAAPAVPIVTAVQYGRAEFGQAQIVDVAHRRHASHRRYTRSRSKKKQTAIIGGSAAGGAVVGGLLGGGKGAAIGALAGGGGGAVYNQKTKNKDH